MQGTYPLHAVDGIDVEVKLGIHDPLRFDGRDVEIDPVTGIFDFRRRNSFCVEPTQDSTRRVRAGLEHLLKVFTAHVLPIFWVVWITDG